MLFYLTISNNNVANVIIDFVFNELFYDFKINDILIMFKNLFIENYFRFKQIKREFIEEIMTFVNIMHKRRYDDVYINVQFKINNYVFFKLHVEYIIFDLNNHKFNQQRVDSFKIIDKIDTFVYRLELLFIMQIHFVIFITQLKFASTLNNDFYRRFKSNNSSFVITKNDDFDDFTQTFNYEIERLFNKRIIFIDKINYLIK